MSLTHNYDSKKKKHLTRNVKKSFDTFNAKVMSKCKKKDLVSESY